jgi:hypothetical protein
VTQPGSWGHRHVAAEVGGRYAGVLGEGGRRAVQGYAAGFQDVGAVAQVEGQAGVLFDQQDGEARGRC